VLKGTTFTLPPRTTFHKFSNWILLKHNTKIFKAMFHPIFILDPSTTLKHKSITTAIQPSLNHPTLNHRVTRTQSRTQNSATTTRSNCNIKYHTSYCIGNFNELNPSVYALLPKQTRVQICKYLLITL